MKPSQPDPEAESHRHILTLHLRWFVRLRWYAGFVALLAGLFLKPFFPAASHPGFVAAMGGVILTYNLLLWGLVRRSRPHNTTLKLAWTQVLLDLACLGLLALWTGGPASPLLGFFVFHMVFASLLLGSTPAYVAAGFAVTFLASTLLIANAWPDDPIARLQLAGWVATLVLTVYLTNHVTRSLRRHRRNLVRRNRRIRDLIDQLQLQQQAMIQHEKMVATGQMAAGIAHEIANPLASMDSILQLAHRRASSMTTDRLDALRTQVERIKHTIHQMKGFAHPTDAVWQQASVNELADHALDLIRFDHRIRKVKIEKQYDASPACVVRVQPHAMEQVMTNILLNALDAMDSAESPTLTLRTACDGSTCRIEVTDTGPGIAPNHIDKLFEPFFTTKPVGKGTGLGLSISYKLMQNQGGTIEVRSRPAPQRGATFTLILPASQKPSPR
ncbi:MAG: hypothetical protein GC164_11485 [Phycisphaera sp.]|nr:hypothetical protein [Phycisphaera sp.]